MLKNPTNSSLSIGESTFPQLLYVKKPCTNMERTRITGLGIRKKLLIVFPIYVNCTVFADWWLHRVGLTVSPFSDTTKEECCELLEVPLAIIFTLVVCQSSHPNLNYVNNCLVILSRKNLKLDIRNYMIQLYSLLHNCPSYLSLSLKIRLNLVKLLCRNSAISIQIVTVID